MQESTRNFNYITTNYYIGLSYQNWPITSSRNYIMTKLTDSALTLKYNMQKRAQLTGTSQNSKDVA